MASDLNLADHTRLASMVERLANSVLTDARAKVQLAESWTHLRYKVDEMMLRLANLEQRIVDASRIDSAESHLVAEKVDSVRKDITDKFPIVDLRRGPVSTPPPKGLYLGGYGAKIPIAKIWKIAQPILLAAGGAGWLMHLLKWFKP